MDHHFSTGDNLQVRDIVHGACGWKLGDSDVSKLRGADRLADGYGFMYRVPVIRVPADWDRYGLSAGPRRNKLMVDMKPDVLVAFPGGNGTASMVGLAADAGIETIIVKEKS